MTKLPATYSRRRPQGKNPYPKFIEPDNRQILPFCRSMIEKAQGFTNRVGFIFHVELAKRMGKRIHRPSLPRCMAIDALIQAMCFHLDPLAGEYGCVNCSVKTLAIECGLTTNANTSYPSITRAIRALKSLDNDFGFIIYETEFVARPGFNARINIQFTPALYKALGVSMESLEAVRNSHTE